jgi:hypothetical protein
MTPAFWFMASSEKPAPDMIRGGSPVRVKRDPRKNHANSPCFPDLLTGYRDTAVRGFIQR